MLTEISEDISYNQVLSGKIKELKHKKNAVVLAHYYQDAAIQEIADFIGDSLELSRKAAQTDADIIVFAGVHFMAETAKILNPGKKVLMPDIEAGCSLAEGCPADEFRNFLEKYPEHTVITYINCTAEIKAMSDIICTSGNALKIINSLPGEEKIIFAPDKNLGKYLMQQTGREMILWDAVCEVHEEMDLKQLIDMRKRLTEAKLIAHPECTPAVLAIADFTGSTSKMLKFTKEDKSKQFIVVTEEGILHQMKKQSPEKKFFSAPTHLQNACACSECRFMKKNTLQKVYDALKYEQPEIVVDPFVAQQAAKAIYRMLEFN
jgi:quinolinate synthase